jgi:hypothetical protein
MAKKASTKRKKCSFIDDKADHSGEGTDGGDTDDDGEGPSKSDEEFLKDEASEVEEEELPKLTRKERTRLSKGDLDVVSGRASRCKEDKSRARRSTVWKDSDESDADSDDDGFVVTDEEDEEAARRVQKAVRKGLAESGVVTACTGAPLKVTGPSRPSGLSLEITKAKPFYLKPGGGSLLNGASGKAVAKPAQKLRPANNSYEDTMNYLKKNPMFSRNTAIPGMPDDQRPYKKLKPEQEQHRPRVRPFDPQRKPAAIFLGPARKPPAQEEKKQEAGMYHNTSTGEVYYRHADGRKSPRPGALG